MFHAFSSLLFPAQIIRSFTMLALLTLRFRSVMGGGANRCAAPMADDQAIRVPLLLPICFLGVCLCLVLVTIVQSFWTSIVGLSILACGLGIYTLCIWEGALQRFACYQRAAHLINRQFCTFTLHYWTSSFFSLPTSFCLHRCRLRDCTNCIQWQY